MRTLLAFFVIANAAPSMADGVTVRIANEAGEGMGSFTRARLLCLAAGIPMPEMSPQLAASYKTIAAAFPNHFALGFQRGTSAADAKFRKPRVDTVAECKRYRSNF